MLRSLFDEGTLLYIVSLESMNAQHEDKESINGAANTGNDSNKTKATMLLTNALKADNSNESMTLQDDPFPEKQDEGRKDSDKDDQDDKHSNDDSDTSSYCVICLNACEDRTVLETCHRKDKREKNIEVCMTNLTLPFSDKANLCDDQRYAIHRFEPLASASKKSIAGSTSSSSASGSEYRRSQQIAVPYGIIRQLYGPPQQRRRFRDHRNTHTNESAIEQSVTGQQQQALDKRRHVYRHRLFVKHIGANRISGFQQITPETFRIFPHKLDRLTPWIRRELQAILSLTYQPTSDSSSLTSDTSGMEHGQRQDADRGLELIREYITAVLKRHDLQTDQAQDLLRDFLYEHTEQFVHELMGFARSPYSIDAYDKVAQYDSPPSMSTSATALIESCGLGEPHARTGDSMGHRNKDQAEYSVQDRSSEGSGRHGRRGRSHTRSESNDRCSQSRQRRRSRSLRSDGHGSESFRSTKRHRNSREERRGEDSRGRHGHGDSESISREKSRGRSRSKDRRSARHIEKKSQGTEISNEATAEFPTRSVQTSSEAGRDNMGHVAAIDGVNTAKPGHSPSTNRDAIIAALQAKLKRERDLYNANIHNKPTT
ncbi:hypothetical protein BGX26_009770 [Mortierella sp. AD094]|nr:hypothetical protein BGX26_009770 [Mortierella sp. AD094]